MNNIKEFVRKNKMIVILVSILIVLLLAIGISLALKPISDHEKTEIQTEQTVDTSKESGKTEDEKDTENSEDDKNENPSSTVQNNDESSAGSSKNDAASNAGSSGSSGGSSNAGSSSKTDHEHSWKTHTAQKWVSNMVTVPDYETQKVAVGTRYIFAYDGYTTTSDADAENHAMELILAGHPDNYRMETIYEEKQVQVGSHQEDHGHYETYVDYEYCDCGATK